MYKLEDKKMKFVLTVAIGLALAFNLSARDKEEEVEQQVEEKVFKTKLAVLNPAVNVGGDKFKAEIVALLSKSLEEIGGYEMYDEAYVTETFENIEQRVPKNCNEPRCASAIGTTVAVDRVVYGSVDKMDKSYGVKLYLIDVPSKVIIEKVALEGDAGISLGEIIEVAVNRLHGYADSEVNDKIHKYFGKQVHNEKQMLISSGAWVAAGLIWTLVNGNRADGTTLYDYEVKDELTGDLSGIPTDADIVPLYGRPSALGNAYIAASDDAYGVFYNPAGLSWVGVQEAAFGYQYQYGMMNNFFASYVNKATREIGYGHGFHYSGDDLYSETNFYSSISYRFNQLLPFLHPLSVGAKLKMISKKTGDVASDSGSVSGSAFGFGLDLGAQLELSDKIRGAILVKNVPTIVKWKNASLGTDYNENLPVEFILGGTFQASYGTFIICEGHIPMYKDQLWKGSAGIEQNLARVVNLRLGVEKEEGFDTSWKFTGGFGLRIPIKNYILNVDGSYAYDTFKPMANIFNVSLRFAL